MDNFMFLWVEVNNGVYLNLLLAISEDFQQKVYFWNGSVVLGLWIQIVKNKHQYVRSMVLMKTINFQCIILWCFT